MLRVSHLRKLVKPASDQCPEIPINLQGTELGTPVSIGATVTVAAGQVTATGTGYDFVNGVLEVTPAPSCSVPNHTTFTISGTGPIPDLALATPPSGASYVLAVLSGYLYVAYNGLNWAIPSAPVTVASGAYYSLVIVVANNYARAWLNGSSVGRRYIHSTYLGTGPWQLRVGDYYGYGSAYTGHIDSIRWEVGALHPDVDNI